MFQAFNVIIIYTTVEKLPLLLVDINRIFYPYYIGLSLCPMREGDRERERERICARRASLSASSLSKSAWRMESSRQIATRQRTSQISTAPRPTHLFLSLREDKRTRRGTVRHGCRSSVEGLVGSSTSSCHYCCCCCCASQRQRQPGSPAFCFCSVSKLFSLWFGGSLHPPPLVCFHFDNRIKERRDTSKNKRAKQWSWLLQLSITKESSPPPPPPPLRTIFFFFFFTSRQGINNNNNNNRINRRQHQAASGI